MIGTFLFSPYGAASAAACACGLLYCIRLAAVSAGTHRKKTEDAETLLKNGYTFSWPGYAYGEDAVCACGAAETAARAAAGRYSAWDPCAGGESPYVRITVTAEDCAGCRADSAAAAAMCAAAEDSAGRPVRYGEAGSAAEVLKDRITGRYSFRTVPATFSAEFPASEIREISRDGKLWYRAGHRKMFLSASCAAAAECEKARLGITGTLKVLWPADANPKNIAEYRAEYLSDGETGDAPADGTV